MRTKLGISIFVLACVAGGVEVFAQATPTFNCANLDSDPVEIAACAKSMLNRQSLINASTSIQNIIVDRFDAGPNQTEPAGIALNTEQDILDRLSSNGNITIIPTADVAAPAASPLWNVWIDGKYSWLDDTAAFSNLDGSLVNLIVGADYKVSDRLVVGLMGTLETSDLDDNGAVSQQTDGWGGGAYVGLTLTDNVVFSANVLGTALDTDINNVSNVFDSERVQASAALTGYWYSGTWRYSPSLTFAWSKEWQDGNLGLSDQEISTAVISPGIQIGNTITIADASTVEPWLGAQFDAVALNKVVDETFGTLLDDPYTDLRLQGGLNFSFGANAQLALTAEISGLLYDDSDTYTAGANLAFQF